jgi:hypothetical protein
MLMAPRAAARRRPGQEFSARLHSLRHRPAEQAEAGGQHAMRSAQSASLLARSEADSAFSAGHSS